MVIGSVLSAGVSQANVAPPPGAIPTPYPAFRFTLAQDPAVTAAYALVPNDAPALLPLEVAMEGGWTTGTPVNPILETVPLSVDGDPTGTMSAFFWRSWPFAELAWTAGAARELGRTYTASLASAVATTEDQSQVYYTASSFEFSYFDGTSAEFLPQVEFTLSDLQEIYGAPPPACCEVDASLCSEAASCFQCWDRWALLRVYGVWTGPGLPYLSLTTEPPGAPQVEEFGEFCIEGTASAAGETRTVTACRSVTEWPAENSFDRDTVFADTCKVMPEGYYPLTRLFVVRAETEAEALQLLSGDSAAPAGASVESSPPSRCALSSRPAESSALPWLAALALVGAVGRRRLRAVRVS